jgi:hypothetical protein
MYETEGLKNDIIYQFYYIALFDYEKGNDVDELKLIMYDYEDKELYLECEGIRLAIEYIEFLELIKEIIDE